MSEEHCFKCDSLTGRAGRADDSLYTEDSEGPYCEDCYHKTADYLWYCYEDVSSQLAQAADRIAALEEAVARKDFAIKTIKEDYKLYDEYVEACLLMYSFEDESLPTPPEAI